MELECYGQAPIYVNRNRQHLEISTSRSSPLLTPLLRSERQMRGFGIVFTAFVFLLSDCKTKQGIICAHSSAPHLLQGRDNILLSRLFVAQTLFDKSGTNFLLLSFKPKLNEGPGKADLAFWPKCKHITHLY